MKPVRKSTGATARRKKLADPPPRPSTPPSNPDETDPTAVTRPVGHVHESLAKAWALRPHRQMCVRFDVVNPLMQFKRGSTFSDDEAVPFPVYDPSPEEDPDVTESDDEDNPLEQYEPLFLEQCVSAMPFHSPLALTGEAGGRTTGRSGSRPEGTWRGRLAS